jgi:hypothetical protein
MAPLDDNMMPTKGTTFYAGSCIFVADGSGGFDSHLIEPSTPETSKAAWRRETDDFVDQLNEIPLPVHINGIRNQSDFDITTPKSLSELEDDLDHLLEVTRSDAIVNREAPALHLHQDHSVDDTKPEENEIPPITIENYLKDLMAIPRPRVDNSDLLDGIDYVSHNIIDCINLAESSLRKKKSRTKPEKISHRPDRTSDIFSRLDRIDDKISYCIKLAQDTLNSGGPSEQEELRFENPWASKEYNPRFDHPDIDRDQAFIDYLNELDGPIPEDELIEWLDDIDLFLEGLSNPANLKNCGNGQKPRNYGMNPRPRP